MSAAPADLRTRWKQRPRNRFVRGSLLLFLGLLIYACVATGLDLGSMFSADALSNAGAYWNEEVKPPALRGRPWDWGIFADWAGTLLHERGWSATLATLAISVLAIVLATLAGLLLSLPAARTLASPEPYLPGGTPPGAGARLAWTALRGGTRVLLVLMRSLPEYVLAFLLLAVIGKTAWPAVLALAIHNAGILGRLNAEVVENLPPAAMQALRAGGAGRLQIACFGILPAALPRFLLYFFYRWETCVREATVLGMLGLGGLGYWINEARAHEHHDEMIFYVVLASGIVLVGDLLSALARGIVRRA